MDKRHAMDLGVTVLLKELAQTVMNVLYVIHPGYAFIVTQRSGSAWAEALRDTWTVTAYKTGRTWTNRELNPLLAAAHAAHLTALRLLTGGTREIAALGPFANRVQVAVGFQSAAIALGAVDASATSPSSFSETWEVGVVAANEAVARRILAAAAHAAGCQTLYGSHGGTVGGRGADGTLTAVSGVTIAKAGDRGTPSFTIDRTMRSAGGARIEAGAK